MRIGLLTGGGDCPGLNAAIRAVVRKGIGSYQDEFVGFHYGWAGVLAGDAHELGLDEISGIIHQGGTILGSSRTNPFAADDGVERVQASMDKYTLDGIIAIGGEDTLGAAYKLAEAGLPICGLPKTIDNDLNGTDVTFGFDTAVQIATDALDRLHTTAASHNRVLVLEVMGRHAGWIALHSGLAGGADVILIPEQPFDMDEVCGLIDKRAARGRKFSIVVVAEGAVPKDGELATIDGALDSFGHARIGGMGQYLEREIETRTGYETRATVLGHIQRGGTPTAFDRVLATRMGAAIIDGVHAGEWGTMSAARGSDIILVPLAAAVKELKTVPSAEYQRAAAFFG